MKKNSENKIRKIEEAVESEEEGKKGKQRRIERETGKEYSSNIGADGPS